MHPEHGPKPVRHRRRLWILIASTIGGLLLVELALRWVLFGGGASTGFTAEMRQARRYADPLSSDDYWKLFLEVERGQEELPPNLYHPVLGWVTGDIDAQTLKHVRAGEVGSQRPILLYGDSYAHCMTSPSECFQGLVESSDLGSQFCLLNYGVRGYGLDQMYLLLERTVDDWSERRPVVVIGFLVDEAVDRVVLHLRGWSKPRFSIVDGKLVPETVPVPRAEQYVAEHPIGIASYAWRYVLYASGLLPERLREWCKRDAALEKEKQVIARRIVESMQELLEKRHIPYFFLLFHGEHFLSGVRRPDWRESFLVKLLEERKIPYVSASHVLRDHARWYRHGIDRYFGRSGNERDHYLPLTNEIAFEALRAGLEQHYEPWGAPTIPYETFRGALAPDRDVWLDHDPDWAATALTAGGPQSGDRLCVRARNGGAKVVRYPLDGRCHTLTGLARLVTGAECAPSASRARLTFECEGARIFEAELRAGEPGVPFEIDLSGSRELVLSVEIGEGGAPCALVGLTRLCSH